MLKRISCLLFCLVMLMGLTVPAWAEESESANAIELYVDDNPVENARAADFDGTVYVSLFYVTASLRPDMAAYWEGSHLSLTAEGLELTARKGSCYMTANGRYLYIPAGVKADADEELLVPVDTLARALGAPVSTEGNAIRLQSGGDPIQSGDEFYDAEAVDLLGRVIRNESGNQSMQGQIAVGNVLLNRVESPIFPDTLYDVVYQPGQFPGTTRKETDSDSVIAAKLCLDGAVVVDNAYWFSGVGRSCWASRNKELVATIGGHAFYG